MAFLKLSTQNVYFYGLEFKWAGQVCINTPLIATLASKRHLFGYVHPLYSEIGLQRTI